MADSHSPYQIQPGRSLGWITLGSSLHSVISRVKAQPQIYPHIDLSYSQSHPVSEPIIVNLPSNGIRLRFDGPDQRLRLIEVLNFSLISITYKNTELVRKVKTPEEGLNQPNSSLGPTFRHVYNRLFGPAYEGEYISPQLGHSTGTYVLSYPGLALLFPVRHKHWSEKADFVSILSSSATSPATSMSIFSGSSWPEARTALYTKTPLFPRAAALASKNAETTPDEIEEVRLYGAGKVEFMRRSTPSVTVLLGETTPQDLVAEFGPPDAIYRKHDSRVTIHATGTSSKRRRSSASPALDPQGLDTDQSSIQSYTEDSDADSPALSEEKHNEAASECFYNYFNHGFDALISFPRVKSPPFPGSSSVSNPTSSSTQLVVTKIFLHANVPGSYSFNRHRRSRWTIWTDPDASQHTLNSEMSFSEIAKQLQDIWKDSYSGKEEEKRMQRGMVLNRGWGESPESSIELLGGFEESTSPQRASGGGIGDSVPNLSNTELFGFPGLLFEVLKNDAISCVTVY